MSETPLKQLTDSNSNNFYPVTSSSGVYRPDSSTVEAALAAIPTATSDLENDSNFISEGQANSVTGSMIQDNTVTAGNINFATFPYMIATLNSNPVISDGTRIQFDGFEQDGGFVSTNQNSVFEVPVTGLYELSAALGVGRHGTSDVTAYCRVRYCSSSGEAGDTIFTLYEQGSGNYAKSSCPSYLVRINAGSFIGLFSNTSGTIGLGDIRPTFLSLRFLRP